MLLLDREVRRRVETFRFEGVRRQTLGFAYARGLDQAQGAFGRDVAARTAPRGPLHWQYLVEWLSEDGIISAEEARRTIARLSQTESALHPLVRMRGQPPIPAADRVRTVMRPGRCACPGSVPSRCSWRCSPLRLPWRRVS